MSNLRKKNVTYQNRGWLSNWFKNISISIKRMFNPEVVDLWVKIKSGDNISEPIKDLIYKHRDGTFRSVKTKMIINDELDNDYMGVNTKGKPYMEAIFNNGTGDTKFFMVKERAYMQKMPSKTETGKYSVYKIKGLVFDSSDVRVNDIFEETAKKLFMMFDADRLQKTLALIIMFGLIGLGIFNLLSYMGLSQVINKGIEQVVLEAGQSIGNTIPPAP